MLAYLKGPAGSQTSHDELNKFTGRTDTCWYKPSKQRTTTSGALVGLYTRTHPPEQENAGMSSGLVQLEEEAVPRPDNCKLTSQTCTDQRTAALQICCPAVPHVLLHVVASVSFPPIRTSAARWLTLNHSLRWDNSWWR